MTQETDTPTDPAEAFEAMRRELSLVRRAVEGLTAARETIPDYSATLGQMAQDLKSIDSQLQQIEASPAIGLTPETVAQQINKAAQDVRAEDRRDLHDARDALSRSLGHVDAMVKRGRSANQRREHILWMMAGALLIGALLWSFLPGTIARALPESWHVPEWMAARTMGMEQRDAGQRLIEIAGDQGEREKE